MLLLRMGFRRKIDLSIYMHVRVHVYVVLRWCLWITTFAWLRPRISAHVPEGMCTGTYVGKCILHVYIWTCMNALYYGCKLATSSYNPDFDCEHATANVSTDLSHTPSACRRCTGYCTHRVCVSLNMRACMRHIMQRVGASVSVSLCLQDGIYLPITFYICL
jgi:hypothetical protein